MVLDLFSEFEKGEVVVSKTVVHDTPEDSLDVAVSQIGAISDHEDVAARVTAANDADDVSGYTVEVASVEGNVVTLDPVGDGGALDSVYVTVVAEGV